MADVWVFNILKIIIAIVAVHLTLTKIMPLVQNFLAPFLDKKAVDSLTSLLGVLVLIIGGLAIVEFIIAIGNDTLSYLSIIGAGLEIVKDFFDYLQYIILVVLGIAVFKGFKKR